MLAAFLVMSSAGPPDRLSAQGPITIAGRLVRVHRPDTTAIPGEWVVAHEVGQQKQGPIDSMRTDALGRFRFVVAHPDTATIYVVSTRHHGIGYFSEPVQEGIAAHPLTLVVFDTAVAGPPLSVSIRHIVVTKGDQGQKRVLDIFQVENPGQSTRVGRDSTTSVWSAKLPAGVTGVQPGEGDVPANAIRFSPGRVDVIAPFPPGLKQVVVTYDVERGNAALTIPVDQPTERMEILVEDSSATVSQEFGVQDPVRIENRTFRRWAADSVPAGAKATVTFGDLPSDSRRFTWIAVAVAALALGAGAFVATRRRVQPPESEGKDGEGEFSEDSDERIAAQIAALDDKFDGREADTPPETWATYQQRRTALKAELAARVARA